MLKKIFDADENGVVLVAQKLKMPDAAVLDAIAILVRVVVLGFNDTPTLVGHFMLSL